MFFKFPLLTCFLVYPGLVSADYLNCPCKIVKVIDGDTVQVLDQTRVNYKIRLGGIDAPETKQAFGRKSTQNLSRLVTGKTVEVEYYKRERSGLILGKLIKDGQDINLLQIKQGYAWHYNRNPNEQSGLDRMLYRSAETTAREKIIGLWSAPAVPPWEYKKKN